MKFSAEKTPFFISPVYPEPPIKTIFLVKFKMAKLCWNNILMDLQIMDSYVAYDGRLVDEEVVDSDYSNDCVSDIEEI